MIVQTLELLDGYMWVEILETKEDCLTVRVLEDNISDVDANPNKMFPPGKVFSLSPRRLQDRKKMRPSRRIPS